MPTDNLIKQVTLPFQRDRKEQIEAGAILALAELERIKGGGFINKQVGEELCFIIKGGYPLWLYPRNAQVFLFDGLRNTSLAISYPAATSSEALKENLQTKGGVLESFIDHLSENGNLFQNSRSDQFLLSGLISDPALKNEFIIYQSEALEIDGKSCSFYSLFAPALSKKALDDNFTKLYFLQLALYQESQGLTEYIRQIRQVTDQHKTELDFLLTATIEEGNAKIKACEELINPQVERINRKYKRQIAIIENSYYKKIKEIESKRNRAQKSVDKAEEKISDYKIETNRQAYAGHYYERRWAKKFSRLERELNAYARKLDAIAARLERVTNAKDAEIGELDGNKYSQTESLRQPLYTAQIEKSDKIKTVQQRIHRLLELESILIDGINRTISEWDLNKSFQDHSLNKMNLAAPVLVYVPFYLFCYQSGQNKRFLVISPSTFGKVDFSDKLKGLFGITKIRELLTPRFQSIAALLGNAQELVKNDGESARQISVFSSSHNLLKDNLFRRNAQEGLVKLKEEGWLSDRELQSVNRFLFSKRKSLL